MAKHENERMVVCNAYDAQLEVMTELLSETRALRAAVERGQGTGGGAVSCDRPLTREEAAEYLGVYVDTVYDWAVRDGKIPYSRLNDGKRAPIRFMLKDLEDFVKRARVDTVEDRRLHLR